MMSVVGAPAMSRRFESARRSELVSFAEGRARALRKSSTVGESGNRR